MGSLRGRVGVAIVLVVLVPGLAGCIKDPLGPQVTARGLGYLVGRQLADGGFPSTANGTTSDFSTTCWVALALVAAGAPQMTLDRAKSYLEGQAGAVANDSTGAFNAINAVAVYALAGLALGVPEARWNGTDPLARLSDWADNESVILNEQIFIVGTLGRAGRTSETAALRESLRSRLNGGNESELVTDAWFRSNAILAMLASGDSTESEEARLWARSLLQFQKEDAGFFSQPQYEPDASTTASVLGVLSKVRFVYSHERTTATEFLAELQQPEGWIRFSEEFDFGRDKTTGEAILGITGKGVFGA